MPIFAECCVLIPCSTIEDFPSKLGSTDAQSLLGALTAAWHPYLIANLERLPSWSRGDDQPTFSTRPAQPDSRDTPPPPRLVLVPEVCIAELPDNLLADLGDDLTAIIPDGDGLPDHWIRVTSRTAAIRAIQSVIASLPAHESSVQFDRRDGHWRELTIDDRTINADDFFALAYTYWQTQTLTRRLRYTSNLDQIHFESCVVRAAKGFCDNDATATAEGLHDAFDALAEERDHYFSSDPALIDLTLLTPSLWPDWIDSTELASTANKEGGETPDTTILPTPQNLLIDESVAASVQAADATRKDQFARMLYSDQVSWCGGGPDAKLDINTASIAEVEQRFADALTLTSEVVGQPVKVFARLGGGMTADLIAAIADSGCQGMVPIDFMAGRGFEDESKVIYSQGGYEIDALVAKPIDANNEADFLDLSIRLGEAIDRGEIASGLFVHWPDQVCDSYRDVRRAATWTLALGKFWRIDDYFTEGENPYHHGDTTACRPSAAIDTDLIAMGLQACRRCETQAQSQTSRDTAGLATLLGVLATEPPSQDDLDRMVRALGQTTADAERNSEALLMVYPGQPAARFLEAFPGRLDSRPSWLFASQSRGGQTDCIVDVPAWGFATLGCGPSSQGQSASGPGLLARVKQWFGGVPRQIRNGHHLSNEFMDVVINPQHGGIDGIYSGQTRGNRFSARWLVLPKNGGKSSRTQQSEEANWSTVVDEIAPLTDKELANSELAGAIRLVGHFQYQSSDAEANDQHSAMKPQGRFEVRYGLQRGSRLLNVEFRYQLPPSLAAVVQSWHDQTATSSEAWQVLPRLRAAVADAGAFPRMIVREKLHRTSSRRFFSPLGYVIDEDTRTTLIAGRGLPYHRRSQERFYDTLMVHDQLLETSQAEWSPWQALAIGIDVREPVSTAKRAAWGQPSCQSFPIRRHRQGDVRGWLMHCKPMSMHVQVVGWGEVLDDLPTADSEGQPDKPISVPSTKHFALHLRLVQTASRSCQSQLTLCHPLHRVLQTSPFARPWNSTTSPSDSTLPAPSPTPLSEIKTLADAAAVKVVDDTMTWTHGAHEVTHFIVVLQNSEPSPTPRPE